MFKTGIYNVDRNFSTTQGEEKGLNPPQLLTFNSDTKSQSEQVLRYMIESSEFEKKTYITTMLSQKNIKQTFKQSPIISDITQIISVVGKQGKPDKIINALREAPKNSLFVIDTVTDIELSNNRNTFIKFINKVVKIMHEKNLFIICNRLNTDTNNSKILYTNSDSVFDVYKEETASDIYEHRMSIQKLRGYGQFKEIIKLQPDGDKLSTDSSRGIA